VKIILIMYPFFFLNLFSTRSAAPGRSAGCLWGAFFGPARRSFRVRSCVCFLAFFCFCCFHFT